MTKEEFKKIIDRSDIDDIHLYQCTNCAGDPCCMFVDGSSYVILAPIRCPMTDISGAKSAFKKVRAL